MNKNQLIGRLTKDPEVRYTNGETPLAIVRFSLAVDRKGAKKDDTNAVTADFIPCVAFGKTAEFIEKYFKKGNKIALIGHLQSGSYTDKDGNKRYTLDVVVEDVEFVEKKNSGDTSSASSDSKISEPIPSPDDGFVDIPDGFEAELPFK